MFKFRNRHLDRQKGQALAIVLCVLAIGSLTVAASLNYSITALRGSSIVNENTDGIYAASAGIEHAIWSLKNGVPPLTQLSEQINHLGVNISTINAGNYTLYLGEFVDFSSKPGILDVTNNITYIGGDQYLFSITVIRTYEPGAATIHLQEVGARLPIGYTYNGSASRSDNKSPGSGNPVQTMDGAGAWMLQWLWPGGGDRPTLRNKEGGDTFSLSFQIAGTGALEGKYAWTIADATGYGTYGEVTGGLYKITATAYDPSDNRTIASITADMVMEDIGTYVITSWKIGN